MKIIKKLPKALGVYMILYFLYNSFLIFSRPFFEKKIYEEIRKRNGKKN